MQRTTIIGRVGKDAEVKELSAGKVINFSVAVTEKWIKDGKSQEKTTWYDCTKWGDSTKIADYIKKGDQIYIEGNCTADAFLKDGEAKAVLRLNVQKIELLAFSSSEKQNASSDDKEIPF
jgi:single-strand DNA-binding protein